MRNVTWLVGAMVACLTGCASTVEVPVSLNGAAPSPPPMNAARALEAYYDQIDPASLPKAPPSPALDPNAQISRILVGSCVDEELDAPLLASMAAADADLTLLIGDNVYGDIDEGRFTGADFDLDLKELADSYADLAALPDFQALMAARPMLATWDDHDYGVNDAGGDMPAKPLAEKMFEQFWGMGDTDAASRPGVYYSRTVGPEGRRVQIIMLDTRYFRTPLTHTDKRGAAGKERYLPSDDPDQDMLGDDQWAWLLSQLEQPADLRLIVSSVQITPDVHGWEAWSRLPKSRDKLYDLLKTLAVEDAVFVTGDRHTAFLYENTAATGTPILELTASSINKSFAADPVSDEVDAQQIGLGYTFENYGAIEIDWDARKLTLAIHGDDNTVVRSVSTPF